MNYLEFLQATLTWATVTDDLNHQYTEDTSVVVVRELQGAIYRDSVVKTIQLELHTTDVPTYKALLDTFAKTYNDTDFTDDFDYIKQYYSTPMVLANFNTVGINYSSQIILSGTLIISKNVSSIKRVLIDGEEYVTTDRNLIYTTNIDNQATDNTGKVNTSQTRNAILKFTAVMINHEDTLGEKIKNIRKGNLPINTSFAIKLYRGVNDVVEEYTMKMESHTINDANSNLPVLTISFIK